MTSIQFHHLSPLDPGMRTNKRKFCIKSTEGQGGSFWTARKSRGEQNVWVADQDHNFFHLGVMHIKDYFNCFTTMSKAKIYAKPFHLVLGYFSNSTGLEKISTQNKVEPTWMTRKKSPFVLPNQPLRVSLFRVIDAPGHHTCGSRP